MQRLLHLPNRALSPLPKTRTYGTYLRAVVTPQCPLSCSYCHMEGDPAEPGSRLGLTKDHWIALLHTAVACGVRKLKLVGGEPLLRGDLPEIIASLRVRSQDLDISIITSGTVPRERIDRCFDAGLSRCNITMHGFGQVELSRRGGSARHHKLRSAFVDAVLERGRPLKINYVYTSTEQDEDLGALLTWASGKNCTIGLLDDLTHPEIRLPTLLQAVRRLCGEPVAQWDEEDPDSLPSLRLRTKENLTIEMKDRALGEVAPWGACHVCLRRPFCREGIVALRLTHTGALRPCMDRTDLGVELLPVLETAGRDAVRDTWLHWLRELEAQ